MNIMWSYYLIAIIYVLVVILRLINTFKISQFKKEQDNILQVFSIKKDFFTTVSLICTLVTLLINIAAIVGGKSINVSSIVITLLVIGFTLINSFSNIVFSDEAVLLQGYTLGKDEVETLKIKEKGSYTSYDMTFTKEIDSYNYAKLLVFGKNQAALKSVLEKLVKEEA